MKRNYSSKRRVESAARTRQAIVEAAVRMHGEGIITMSAVAEEAGVSLPTVNKYFPTREDLFDACTSHVAANLEFTPPEVFTAISDPDKRLRAVLQEVYRLHEANQALNWTGYKLEDESPVMAQAMRGYETVGELLADTLFYEDALGDTETARRFIHAALNPLTYRALRLKNGLSYDEAVDYMSIALGAVLNIGT